MRGQRSAGRPQIGLALGSGSARGWAHIGVIRELADIGIVPDLVCGTSIGSLVGGAYCSGHLDELEEWVRGMSRMDVARYLDIALLSGGGAVKGDRLVDELRDRIGEPSIEELSRPFAAVATNLATGQEVWFRDGSLLDAVRASISIPGLFTPARVEEDWLVDGGLVNPVPVSLCRAMGAQLVIAVNLNGGLLGRYSHEAGDAEAEEEKVTAPENVLDRLTDELRDRTNNFLARFFDSDTEHLGLFDVLAASINIMQDRVTRSRMAGDYPDIALAPRLSHLGLMEYHRAGEAIAEGRAVVRRPLPAFEDLLL
jgi:NTE family protein